MRRLDIIEKNWAVRGQFRIARSVVTAIPVVEVHISDGDYTGRGECRPYARYQETRKSVIQQISSFRKDIEAGCSYHDLQSLMPAGAARNAVDCALWDLEAKMSGIPIWERLELRAPQPRETAYTLSLDAPEAMAKAAKDVPHYPLLKIKIGSDYAVESIKAVQQARPDARLIIDANEALSRNELIAYQKTFEMDNIALIEQPLPAGSDNPLPHIPNARPILCADESLHTSADLDHLYAVGYRAVNVKLDKTGGLTEAYKVMRAAKDKGFTVMAGCMVCSSLAIAPMMMLESLADYIDLDGPLLLKQDRAHGLHYDGAIIHPPTADLWG